MSVTEQSSRSSDFVNNSEIVRHALNTVHAFSSITDSQAVLRGIEMRQDINGKTEVIGIIGHPIEHTLSPVIHNTISSETGRNAVYVPFHVYGEGDSAADKSDIESVVKGAYKLNIKGFNVTVPYKSDVIPYLSDIDPLAKKIGAVNTLVRTADGYKGYNTDMPGLYMALQKKDVKVEGSDAVVLGAGGAARAVLAMLINYGAEKIYLVNRSFDKAAALAEEMNGIFESQAVTPVSVNDVDVIKASDTFAKGYLLFQCTSLGLKEDDGLLVDDDEFYSHAAYGFDLVYNPADTPFTKKLESLGVQCDNGLMMLLYQGIIAYQYWMDTELDEKTVNRAKINLCRAIYGENVILTGYMGAGKSTVGKRLAEKLGMDFIDTDEYIVETRKKTIPEIFAEKGEEGFRDIETEAVRYLRETCSNTVISTGGGAVLRDENARLLKETGRVFYLYATPEETFNRVKGDTGRPLLDSESEEKLKEKIVNMLNVRYHAYMRTADYRIDTDGRSVDDIIGEILSNR